MLYELMNVLRSTDYDFRKTANPGDPLAHLFEEWVPYYQLKWAISKVIQPRSILEIGVRFGYSAHAFLVASPGAAYLGVDNDSDTFGGSQGAIEWARQITRPFSARFLVQDSQELQALPEGHWDLVHVDGQQDGSGSFHDLLISLSGASWILVDGYFWTRENFLHVSEFLYQYRDLVESALVIPGYAGELLIRPKRDAAVCGHGSDSLELQNTYTKDYYLKDCGGFDAFKRSYGQKLEDSRLIAVAQIAEHIPAGRLLDLGCGRGELALHMARLGYQVDAVDYSQDAIDLARRALASIGDPALNVRFVQGDVNSVPFHGLYDVVIASDLIEHMTDKELDRLYARIGEHLSPAGIFVLHTFQTCGTTDTSTVESCGVHANSGLTCP